MAEVELVLIQPLLLSYVNHVVVMLQCSTFRKNLRASWPPSFHLLSPEQVFWSPKIIFKN